MIRQRLDHRLQQLETVRVRFERFAEMQRRDAESEALLKVLDLSSGAALRKGRRRVCGRHSRALEIPCSELDKQIEQGVNPIYKFLADRGLLEELEELQVGT